MDLYSCFYWTWINIGEGSYNLFAIQGWLFNIDKWGVFVGNPVKFLKIEK